MKIEIGDSQFDCIRLNEQFWQITGKIGDVYVNMDAPISWEGTRVFQFLWELVT